MWQIINIELYIIDLSWASLEIHVLGSVQTTHIHSCPEGCNEQIPNSLASVKVAASGGCWDWSGELLSFPSPIMIVLAGITVPNQDALYSSICFSNKYSIFIILITFIFNKCQCWHLEIKQWFPSKPCVLHYLKRIFYLKFKKITTFLQIEHVCIYILQKCGTFFNF